ncbi:MAG: OstA-like protein [Crocinitomicaceae bacterium]
MSAIFFAFFSKGQSFVELLPGSDKMIINKEKGYQKLIGNVQFKYQGHLMFCDSAFFYPDAGKIYAYGKVQINKKDTLNLYCDSLYYNSKDRFAKLWGHVRVRDREYKLETDSLDYNVKKGEAVYRNGGVITHITRSDRLTSKIGYYYPDTKNFFFRKNVVYTDDNYKMTTDTMRFQSFSEQVFFYGPTKIDVKNDSTTIYCHSGYFDIKNNKGKFIDEAKIFRPSQEIYGDTLLYDSKLKTFTGIGNVIMKDTTEKVEFRGEHAFANDITGKKYLTECALAIMYQKDDTTYIHADTLFTKNDTLNKIDRIRGNYGVKIYSTSFQGSCDSLTYSKTDSLMKMYYKPVIWNRNSQLTGDSIQVLRSKDGVKRAYIYANAMAISEVDSGKYYNQVAGKNIVGYFANEKLELVHVVGNAKTIYFPEDEKENDSTIIVSRSGMNRLFSSEIKLYLDSGEVVGMTSIEQPDGVFFRLDEIPAEEIKVENFIWRIADRPKRWEDLLDE